MSTTDDTEIFPADEPRRPPSPNGRVPREPHDAGPAASESHLRRNDDGASATATDRFPAPCRFGPPNVPATERPGREAEYEDIHVSNPKPDETL